MYFKLELVFDANARAPALTTYDLIITMLIGPNCGRCLPAVIQLRFENWTRSRTG
jgi:hypothetical protein